MAKKRKIRRGFENCVVAYLRYSTRNQTDLSIEYQRDHVETYCAEQGYTIIKFFIDEAKSATNDKRQAFESMIKEAHNEPPWNKVIVFSFNRFARNRDYDGYYTIELKKLGISVESATEDNSNTPEARLLRGVSASYDAYMPERCAVHTHASLETKARKCLHCGGDPPLGYDVKNEKLVINKYEAQTVRLIFEMYDKNYSYNEMIKVLNEKGRTTKRGSPFKKTSFNSILQQEKYIGVFVWNKSARKNFDGTHNSHALKPVDEQVRVEGGCEAIIDEELFNRVQKKMHCNRRKNLRSGGKNHYMLSGMGKMYCAECGSLMVGASYKSHDKKYRYYVCPNHKQHGCITKNLRASYVEHLISAKIVNLVLNKGNYKHFNELLKEISGTRSNAGLKKELNGVSKAIDNILKVLETCPSEEATERLELLCTKKKELQHRLLSITNTPQITPNNYKDVKTDLYKELKKSPDPIIYDILYNIIEKITVSSDEVEIELNI